jgi:ATP-dependent DNA helicase RecG
MENIDAHNNQVMAVLNVTTGELQFSLLVKGFHFQKALMEEHFNENYLESEQFPKSTFKGKITRTAIILLGKEEAEHFISPSEAKIRWLLKDANGNDKDYAIIGCPMILAVDKVYAKIRNLKYRYIKEGTLFPDEVNQYEPYSIREALNNCIAHQDYTKQGRINVVEMDDQLIFTNLGSFIPGSVEKVVKDDAPEEHYRNRFLAATMFNRKMVDTAGGGIKKIFNFQRERYFPMPDYDLSGGKVKVTISGKILDMEYARLLARNEDLTLEDIILLDKVQKKQVLTELEEKHLKSKKLIEGRKPSYYIGLKLVEKTGQKAAYSKNRAFDKIYYLDLIEKSIGEHKSLERGEIDDLLWKKLPDWMDEKQKKDEKTMKGQFEHMMKLQEKCKELKTSLVGGGAASEGELSMVGKKKKGTAIDDKDKEIEDLKDRLLQAEKNKEIYQK